MAQDDKGQLPEVIYANLVGFNLSNDDVLLEFWEHRLGHATPPMTPEDVVKAKPPILRVVVPFASIKWLRDSLEKMLPTAAENRKAGQ